MSNGKLDFSEFHRTRRHMYRKSAHIEQLLTGLEFSRFDRSANDRMLSIDPAKVRHRAERNRQIMSMQHVYGMPGHLIRRAQQIAVSIFLEGVAPADITPVQYAALVAINDNPGIDATRLSAFIAFDRSTLGNVLERMESKRLILRVPHKADKRIKLLHLSLHGKTVLDEIEPRVRKAQERILAPLSPDDRETFMRILSQLVESNNEISRAPLKSVG